MNGFKKAAALFSVAGMVVLLTACATQLPKPAADMIRDGMKKLSMVTSHTFDIGLNADLNGPPGEPPAKLAFKFGLVGGVEAKDPRNVSLNLKVDGSGNADADSALASVDLRFVKNTLYFMLGKFDVQSKQDIPKDMVTGFVGKWYKLTLPTGFVDSLSQSFAKTDAATLTPDQKKLKVLYEQTNFLVNPAFVGKEDVKGESSYHFKATLDEKAVLAFFKQVSETQSSGFTPDQLKSVDDLLAKVENTSTDIWVGSVSGVINKFDAAFQVQGTNKDPSGTFSIQATLADFDKAVTVEVPADAVDFPFNPFSAPTDAVVGDGSVPLPGDATLVPDGATDEKTLVPVAPTPTPATGKKTP